TTEAHPQHEALSKPRKVPQASGNGRVTLTIRGLVAGALLAGPLVTAGLTLILPIIFNTLSKKTYYIFGIANVITLPMVYCLYLESNNALSRK
ncbi:MAG: hypothetical protein Q9217_002606, partial [Psora testacea]